MSEKIVMKGNVEADAHRLKSFVVKDSNEALKGVIEEAQSLQKGAIPKHWRIYARLLGICSRSGAMVLKKLPPKAVTLDARPPPESAKEVRSSRILSRVVQSKTCIFSDGAHAWPCMAKERDMPVRQVVHLRHEYTKPIQPAGRRYS
jgi:hypothetical protein